jgi:hypothetical protein
MKYGHINKEERALKKLQTKKEARRKMLKLR